MSSLYVTEPPTSGKVVLKTTAGDVEVELWTREAPKTCRNFFQLCMEGYYDNTIFHRVVRSFIVQGGDPTGTGLGGESVYGKPFADEFHQRLRFSHRGLLAMANSGKPNDNRSQFFFTLDRAEELNKKHTIFGKITGDTIFNLLRIGEMETDDNERPLYPHRITSVIVLNCPFDDIVPRRRVVREEEGRQSSKEAKEGRSKNLSLLSFGDEAAEEEQDDSLVSTKIKSSHDVLTDDPRLRPEPAVVAPAADAGNGSDKTSKRGSDNDGEDGNRDSSENSDDENDEEDKEAGRKKGTVAKSNKRKRPSPGEEEKSSSSMFESESASRLSAVRKDIANLQRELLGKSKDAAGRGDAAAAAASAAKEGEKKTESLLAQENKNYVRNKDRKKEAFNRDSVTNAYLEKFKQKLSAANEAEGETEHAAAPESDIPCLLHQLKNCKSCQDTFGAANSDDSDQGWLSHRLVFPKMARDASLKEADDLVVIDPRVARNQAAIAKKKKKREY